MLDKKSYFIKYLNEIGGNPIYSRNTQDGFKVYIQDDTKVISQIKSIREYFSDLSISWDAITLNKETYIELSVY